MDIIINYKMNDNSGIRNQIKILDSHTAYFLKDCSNIELAAVFSQNKNNFEIFEKLLLAKCNEKELITKLLFFIIRYVDRTASIDAIKLIIKCGADINSQKYDTLTFIMLCCYYLKNNIEILELLIENGADVNIKNKTGKTTLMYNLQNVEYDKDLEIFKLLIRKDNQINSKDDNGETPLTLYVTCNRVKIRYDITLLLLDNKSDIYIKNNEGKNVLNIIKDEIIDDCRLKKNLYDIYSLIFNYKNLHNDHLCEFDINFIYKYF